MAAATSVAPGELVAGKYRVDRVIGVGGMGYVVSARHLQLGQRVAIKFLRRGAAEKPEALTRFLREARAVVQLRSEHVARVLDVGTHAAGEPYIVMEYLDGHDLSALMKRRGRIPVGEACDYVIQACEALAEAHALGIIHRDIKLANLFVTHGPAGAPLVKVLDFGVSKTNPFGDLEHDITRTASMLGSPRFMSPEQMRDPRAVDARTDVWSLGVVLYRLVAGQPPFEAATLGHLLSKVMHEKEPPLSSLQSDLPPGFEEVVAHCLRKDPAERCASVAELATALAPFASDPPRARAAAERVAATLGTRADASAAALPHARPSQRPSRPSGPPVAGDTGTAAPWTGTRGGGTKARLSPSLVSLGTGFAAVLAAAAMFAVVHANGRATLARPDAAGMTAASPALDTTTVESSTAPERAAQAAVAADLPPREAEPTAHEALAASDGEPRAEPVRGPVVTGRTGVDEDERARPAVVRAATPRPRAAPRPSAPAPAPVDDDDGIPSTRE